MDTLNQRDRRKVKVETGADLSCKTCRGTGLAPHFQHDWLPILLKLHERGQIRVENRWETGGKGKKLRDKAWRDIIEIWQTEAEPAHIPVYIAAEAAGISKQGFYDALKKYRTRDAW